MIPKQLIQSLQNVKGFNEQTFQHVHQSSEQITSIRINPLKWNLKFGIEDEFKTAAFKLQASNFKRSNLQIFEPITIDWCKFGFYLNERPYFTHDPIFHAGAYYVQEASSMFLWQILEQVIGSNTPKNVLDLCAAPGGKSTLLASYFTNGLIVSNEVIKQRCSVLVENITKWGSDNVIVTNNDPKDFKRLNHFFDVMVIDAPCSGSGLFRKDKNAIGEWSEENVNLCSQRQQRIIADVVDCLKEDGVFIYSTCSYSKQENEDILDWIKTNFNLESIQLNLKESWGIIETLSDAESAYGYRFYPNKVKGEGFFIAAFKKVNAIISNQKYKEILLAKPTKQEVEIVEKLISISPKYFLFKQHEFLRVFPIQWHQQLQIIAGNLYIKKAGVELGAIKGKDFIPSHELAMSCLDMSHIKYFNLNKQQALQYLAKKEVNIEDNSIGWALVKFENFSLGWIKALPNRINNYYPTEWRILKTNF